MHPVARHAFYMSTPDGLTLHVREWRRAEQREEEAAITVVCLHALTRNSRDFEKFAPWLVQQTLGGRSLRVLAPSLRGRGASDWATDYRTYHPAQYALDVLALLAHQKITRALFIGSSLGGIVTMELFLMAPEKIIGAILNDVGPELAPAGLTRILGYVGRKTSFDDWPEAVAAIRRTNDVAFPARDHAFWVMLAQRLCTKRDDRIVLDYDPQIGRAIRELKPSGDLWPAFNSLTAPCLVVRGALSDLLTPEIVARMQEAKPTLQTVDVPNVGHAPLLEEEVAKQEIVRFLNVFGRVK